MRSLQIFFVMVDPKIRNSSWDEVYDHVALVFCDFIAVFLKKLIVQLFIYIFIAWCCKLYVYVYLPSYLFFIKI